MRRRSPVSLAVAAVTAALSATVLTACGPTGTASDAKPSRSPATTSAAPTADGGPSGAPATTPPVPTSTAPASGGPATTAAPASPAAPATDQPKGRQVVLAFGAHGGKVRELQARLAQLHLFDRAPTGWYGSATRSAVSGFQARHGLPASGTVTRDTWVRLRALTRPPTHHQMYPPVAPPPAPRLDPRCLTGRTMCISKTTRTLSWVVDGRVLATMAVRFGAPSTPTREGLFHVTFKSRDFVSTLYHSPMPYAMFFSRGEAVHYSSDFAARGYAGASHGCVNVRDRAAIAKLFDEVRVGDKVVVYW